MTSLDVTFPTYTLSSTTATLNAVSSRLFTNDHDFGNPLVDVSDMYVVMVRSFATAPSVAGIPVTQFLIRFDRRGVPADRDVQ